MLLFGRPGGGKSLASALGLALIERGWRVLMTRTTDLVQRLQNARRELVLEAAIAKLDKYQLVILDDPAAQAHERSAVPALRRRFRADASPSLWGIDDRSGRADIAEAEEAESFTSVYDVLRHLDRLLWLSP